MFYKNKFFISKTFFFRHDLDQKQKNVGKSQLEKSKNRSFGSDFRSFCEQIQTVLSTFIDKMLIFGKNFSENEKVETCSVPTVSVRASNSQ